VTGSEPTSIEWRKVWGYFLCGLLGHRYPLVKLANSRVVRCSRCETEWDYQ